MDNTLPPSAEQPIALIETFLQESVVNGQRVWKTYARTDDLKFDPNNPRDITEKKAEDLIEFLQKYQSLKPLLVDFRPEKLGQLIGGNKRLEGYRKMGLRELWIEPRIPGSDAEAFEMGTIDNMAFGYYVEEKLKAEIHKYEDDLGEDIRKLEAALKEPVNFQEIMKAQTPQKHKWEIVIKCVDEEDMKNKFSQIASLGIPLKAK
jgi:hypothetical protein